MVDKSVEAKVQLDTFFLHLNELGKMYTLYTSEVPKGLVINPEIVAQMSKVEGFYQRPEMATRVTAFAPVIRYFKLDFGVVELIDDWDEKFLHFE